MFTFIIINKKSCQFKRIIDDRSTSKLKSIEIDQKNKKNSSRQISFYYCTENKKSGPNVFSRAASHDHKTKKVHGVPQDILVMQMPHHATVVKKWVAFIILLLMFRDMPDRHKKETQEYTQLQQDFDTDF